MFEKDNYHNLKTYIVQPDGLYNKKFDINNWFKYLSNDDTLNIYDKVRFDALIEDEMNRDKDNLINSLNKWYEVCKFNPKYILDNVVNTNIKEIDVKSLSSSISKLSDIKEEEDLCEKSVDEENENDVKDEITYMSTEDSVSSVPDIKPIRNITKDSAILTKINMETPNIYEMVNKAKFEERKSRESIFSKKIKNNNVKKLLDKLNNVSCISKHQYIISNSKINFNVTITHEDLEYFSDEDIEELYNTIKTAKEKLYSVSIGTLIIQTCFKLLESKLQEFGINDLEGISSEINDTTFESTLDIIGDSLPNLSSMPGIDVLLFITKFISNKRFNKQ